jgi:prevent-host-death family protein
MSVKVSVHQLQDRLPEVLNEVVSNGEEAIVQRNGRDYAVIVSMREWRRRRAGERLDALGSKYRLGRDKQARTEQLLARHRHKGLTAAEQRELRALLAECDRILLRRAKTLDSVL